MARYEETLEEFIERAGGSPVFVSACLAGLKTRYNADARPSAELISMAASARLIPVCPEQLGGLPTPRVKASLVGGDGDAVLSSGAKVINESGRDVTENFLRGARAVLSLAKPFGVKFAIMKENSPSCGVKKTYVDSKLSDGSGVTAAALRILGVDIFVID